MATTDLNSIDDIPRSWRSALASVQLTFPDAVIAGGALRDREQGVKVKDIDIFIKTDTFGHRTIISRLVKAGWADVQLNGDESYGQGQSSRGIKAVLDMKYPGCPSINLIAMTTFALEEFDFGICQIMFDGKRIVRLPDYHHDMAAKQFRMIPKVSDEMYVRSLERWARLKEKYPTWKLHLGSRAETPFVPPKRDLVFNHIDMPGVMSQLQASRLHRLCHNRGIKDWPEVLAGDYVVPKAIAERLAKEMTTTLLRATKPDGNVMVHVDSRAVPTASRIIQDMLEARNRLMDRAARV